MYVYARYLGVLPFSVAIGAVRSARPRWGSGRRPHDDASHLQHRFQRYAFRASLGFYDLAIAARSIRRRWRPRARAAM